MSFMNYNQLEELYAGHNFIAFIDSGTFETLPQLRVVRLDYNLITFLPMYFLQKNALLYIINLSHNKISTISGTSVSTPKGGNAYGWRNMLIVNLSFNTITTINEDDLLPWRNCFVHKFNVNDNNVTFIQPKAFGYLPKLGTLNMNNIKLATFDVRYFMGHVEIERLLIDSSGIKYIHPANISSMRKENVPLIKDLNLDLNILKHIPGFALRGLEKLQVLSLGGNRISNINNESFCGLHALVNISLYGNRIQSLPRASFACASNLKKIDLSRNNLVTLDPQWFDGSFFLRNLVIDQSGIRSITFRPWEVTNLQTLLAIVGYHEITEDRTPEDYEYQLNLMFHEDDEWWVNDCMKPFLEQRMPHLERVIFGDADLHPGLFYLNAIYDVIENSHKTILLLSNQSVDDAWYMTKLRMAVEHMNDTKLEKVILIFLEDIDNDHLPYLVRLLLSRNKPYLLWTEDEEGQEIFWAKVQKSMRSNRQMNNVIPV
ncbi:toll-like receptor 13 [Strongylocentrotus purpuratus]|uniref:TIR domain-containing protein n=1 Tax=Strongylocentrotus purpuratus TaxID=7668 RepID=A0A7M7NP66_STRPU|nr:toll-like receptor 13 [Strongylocentrotus purpuratus]